MVDITDNYSFYLKGTIDKAVLLIHGLTGSPSEMRYIGKKLHQKGFTVYAPLLAGHGASMKDLLKTSWQDWYHSVENAYSKLNEEFSKVYAAGICAGGSLGLMLAAHKNDVAGVTLYSPTFKYDGWNMPRYYSVLLPLLAYIPLLRNRSYPETYPYGLKGRRLRDQVAAGKALVEGALDEFPLQALVNHYKLNKQVKKVLSRIKTPTQVIHAIEDDCSHPRNAQYIKDNIAGPCHIDWLSDSYHMVHVDQERKKVVELTAQFFGADKDLIRGSHV